MIPSSFSVMRALGFFLVWYSVARMLEFVIEDGIRRWRSPTNRELQSATRTITRWINARNARTAGDARIESITIYRNGSKARLHFAGKHDV